MKKGSFDKRHMDFREKQRQKSLKLRQPSRTKEKPIKVKPFDGIGYIEPVNLLDYIGISHSVFHPSEGIENAVSCLMVNMLLGLEDNIFKPRKYYSKQEEKYTKEQLMVFRNSLSALEISFGDRINSSVGRFGRKDSYHFSDAGEFVFSELWKGESNYDIVYVRNPSWMVFDKDHINMSMGDIVEDKYREDVERLKKLTYDLEDGGLEYVAKQIGLLGLKEKDLNTDEEEFYKEFCGKCRQYLDENKDLKDPLKGDLEKFIEMGDIIQKVGQEIDEEAKKVSDEKTIVTGMSQNLAQNGVLILESSEVEDIEGLRFVCSYDDVKLYQKV